MIRQQYLEASPNVDARKNMQLEMFTIQNRAGREIVSRSVQGRSAGGASLEFVRWMHGHVPRHRLNPDQAALVEWFDEYKKSDREIGTVNGQRSNPTAVP